MMHQAEYHMKAPNDVKALTYLGQVMPMMK